MHEYARKFIANENKKYIIKKLKQYYEATIMDKNINTHEYAISTFWKAKKQGRLDNLNRLIKKWFYKKHFHL